ncbi:MAG: hypothetical protein HOL28_01965 [Crocinitomicaceae bacterium]|nr:hypothetical protein [Crocinitomicaceae bacterium]
MMKVTLLIITSLFLLFGSCKNKHKIAQAEAEMESLSTENADSTIVNDAFSDLEDDFDFSETATDSGVFEMGEVVTVLERGACFGRCPIYKVKIYSSGYASYEGVNFVDQIGLYQTQFSEKELADIALKGIEFGLDTMALSYDQPRVTDLPTTYIGTTINGELKTIKMRYGYPESLRHYRNFLEELIKSKTWTIITVPNE